MRGRCWHHVEGWWTYELCFEKHMRQFHLEVVVTKGEGKSAGQHKQTVTQEFLLGKFDAAQQRRQKKAGQKKKSNKSKTSKKKKQPEAENAAGGARPSYAGLHMEEAVITIDSLETELDGDSLMLPPSEMAAADGSGREQLRPLEAVYV